MVQCASYFGRNSCSYALRGGEEEGRVCGERGGHPSRGASGQTSSETVCLAVMVCPPLYFRFIHVDDTDIILCCLYSRENTTSRTCTVRILPLDLATTKAAFR